MRIGQGFDVHALVLGRPLILGGILIPNEKGLEGHSDADVLIHALIDALLGACAMGDIGQYFPDTDSQWQGVDSKFMLATVYKMVHEAGYKVVNVDSTVIAERPKLAPYIPDMCEMLSSLLNVSTNRVNVKAKTSERLGMVGREECIVAMVSVLLSPL